MKSSTFKKTFNKKMKSLVVPTLPGVLLCVLPVIVSADSSANTNYYFADQGSALTSASQTLSLDFSEAVERTLNANPARGITQSQIAQAQAAFEQAQGNLLPSLDLSFAMSASDNPLNVFGMKLNQRQASFNDFGVAEYLNTSGFLNPDGPNPADIERANRLEPDALNDPSWHTNFQTALSLQVPVYNGGKIRQMRAQAEALLRAARAGDQAAEQELVMHTVLAYGGVETADAFVQVAKRAEQAADSYLALSERLYDQGVVTRADVLNAEVNLGERQLLRHEAQDQYDNALDGLKVLIGLSPDSEIKLDEVIEVKVFEQPLERAREVAIHKNPKIAALSQQIQAARSEVGVAQAAYRPHFNVMAQQEFNSETPGLRNDSYMIAGQLNWTIWDFGAREGGVDRARAKVHEHQAQRQQSLNELINQIGDIYRQAQLAEKRVDVRALAIERSEEAARLEKVRYEQGISTLTELLQAQANLDHARAEWVRARFERLQQRAALWLATGRMSADRIETQPRNETAQALFD